MNKLYFLTILALSSSPMWAATYLKNSYGAPVEFIEKGSDAETYNASQKGTAAKKLDNGTEKILTNTYFDNALSIRTIGGKFQDVSYILKDIAGQVRQNPNDDAIITISSSVNPYYKVYWHLVISWRQKR